MAVLVAGIVYYKQVKEERKLSLNYIPKVVDGTNDFWTSLIQGAEMAAKEYNIKKVVITHLEEDWGKSYDDYLKLENEYEGIVFAYDGMTLEV